MQSLGSLIGRPCWLVLALAIVGSACVAGDAGATDESSLVLITLDTLRRDHVGVYGDVRGLTPRLDGFAQRGLVHDAALTTMPTTAPAHVSIMTGLSPSEHRVRRNGMVLSPKLAQRTLATRLAAAGYRTGAFVTARFLSRKLTGLIGFAAYDALQVSVRSGREAIDAALVWLDANAEGPVFIWVHIYDPHSPYGPYAEKNPPHYVNPEDYGFVGSERYADRSALGPMLRGYARGVRAADEVLGTLLDGVEARLDDPLIVVLSDHGESLDEHVESRGYAFDHGEFLDDESIFVPLIVAGPGVEAGRSSSAVSVRDLYTTMLAAAGIVDELAAEERRRDLRFPSDQPRAVVVERRSLVPDEREKVGAAVIAQMKSHEVAVSDGARTVILDSQGEVTSEGQAPPALVAAARARLDRLGAHPEAEQLIEVDREVEDALRGLGHIQ